MLQIVDQFDHQIGDLGTLQRVIAYFCSKQQIKSQQQQLIQLAITSFLRVARLMAIVFYECEQRSHSRELLNRYYHFLKEYTRHHPQQECNNLSIMYINMDAHYHLTFNSSLVEVRNTLEQSLPFEEDQVKCDPLLLAVSLNNLSCVLLRLGQFEAAFRNSLQAIKTLEVYINRLKIEQDSKLPDRIVVLINSYYLLTAALKAYLKQQAQQLDEQLKQEYVESMQAFYERGIQMTTEYLGKRSIFTKLFKKLNCERPPTNRLPVVLKMPVDGRKQEDRLIKQLQRAVNNCIDQKFEEIHSLLLTKTSDKNPPGMQLIYETMTKVDSNRTLVAKVFQSSKGTFGQVKLSLDNKGITVCRKDIEQQTIVGLQNESGLLMSIPFELQLQTCSPYEFLKYFIVPNVKTTPTNKLEFSISTLGLLNELIVEFLAERSKVIVTHVKGCMYRLCIHADKSGYILIVLQIGDFNSENQVLVEVVPEGEAALSLSASPEAQQIEQIKAFLDGASSAPTSINRSLIRYTQLVRPKQFRSAILNAIEHMSNFITTNFLGKFTKQEIFDSEKFMFKFHLKKLNGSKASIHALTHINDDALEVTVQNNYQTMGQNNPIKAKGVYLYSLQEFEEDFGMKFTHLRNKTERLQLYDIVLKIFTLKTYNQPLSEIEMRLYNENAIRKQQLIRKVFRRTYLRRQFYVPVTACLLAIAGEQPIGVKLSFYSEGENTEKGAFLTVDCQRWRRRKTGRQIATRLSAEKMSKLDRYKYKQEYDMVSEFNLADVLLKGGFELLLEQFQEDERQQNSFSLKVGSLQLKWERMEVLLTMDKVRRRLEQAM